LALVSSFVWTSDEVELADALETVVLRMMCGQGEAGLDALATAELSVTQLRCLFALAAGTGEIPIHTLAERVCLTLATAGRAVDRLLALGLVTRREDPGDRRVRRVALSAAGRQLITGLDSSRRKALLAFGRSLSAPHAEHLLAALRPIARTTLPEEQLV
jgi:DNA-binding MarR family transcriptional regulator